MDDSKIVKEIEDDEESSQPTVDSIDLNSLKLHLYAEFSNWQEFVDAVDEFQKQTLIKLTITTSKKVSPDDRGLSKCSSGGEGRSSGHGGKRLKSGNISDNDGSCQVEGTSRSINKRKRQFDYKYLKLTCKHYGSYRSTSKGIRPNQRTTKLMCPTYIYGSYDQYKEKFVIKQMKVACNHELKDEEVLLPRLLRLPTNTDESQTNDSNHSSTSSTSPPNKKRYIKIRNRNVLKIPLQSPANFIVNFNNRIKCNHKPKDACQAANLTSDDIVNIESTFSNLSKDEQDELILNWIEARRFTEENGRPSLQLFIRLPTVNGTLLPVCYETFLHVLRVSSRQINDIICSHYGRIEGDEEEDSNDDNDSQGNQSACAGEIETSVANILTSFAKEGTGEVEDDSHQIIYCDTVDMPQEDTMCDDVYVKEETIQLVHSPSSSSATPTTLSLATSATLASSVDNNDSSPFNRALQNNRTNNQSTTNLILNYPAIKVSPIVNGFSVDIDCDFGISLHGVSLENDSKSVKLCFGPH